MEYSNSGTLSNEILGTSSPNRSSTTSAGDAKNNTSSSGTVFAPSQYFNSSRQRRNSASSDDSRTERKKRVRVVWNCLTCKELDYDQYRKLLLGSLLFNLLMGIAEILRCIYILRHPDHYSNVTASDNHRRASENAAVVLSLLATCLTFFNCGLLGLLTRNPMPRIAVLSLVVAVLLEIVYIIQTILYFKTFSQQASYMGITCSFLLIQLGTVWLLYRLWEFAFFNHDDGLRQIVENYVASDSSNRNTQDLEEALNPAHERNSFNIVSASPSASPASSRHKTEVIQARNGHV